MEGSPSKPIELKIDVIRPVSILFAGASRQSFSPEIVQAGAMKGLIKYYFIVWYCIFTALIRHLKKEKKYSLGRLAGRCY